MGRLQRVVALGLLVTFFNTGCANRAAATVDPTARMDAIRSVHVQRHDKDTRDVDVLVSDAFRARGFQVTTGPGAPPTKVDAVVTYVDKWFWDITMYLLELTVTVRDPETQFPLATGNSMHTSLSRLTPDKMADEVVGNIVKQSGMQPAVSK